MKPTFQNYLKEEVESLDKPYTKEEIQKINEEYDAYIAEMNKEQEKLEEGVLGAIGSAIGAGAQAAGASLAGAAKNAVAGVVSKYAPFVKKITSGIQASYNMIKDATLNAYAKSLVKGMGTQINTIVNNQLKTTLPKLAKVYQANPNAFMIDPTGVNPQKPTLVVSPEAWIIYQIKLAVDANLATLGGKYATMQSALGAVQNQVRTANNQAAQQQQAAATPAPGTKPAAAPAQPKV